MPGGVADVSNLVLQRDLARFTLKSGKLYLLTPIGGRTVAALFRGTGTFSFAPTSPVEQHRLARYENKTALEAPFTDVLLMFADTTMAELRRLTFRAEAAPGEVRERVRDGLKYLSDEDSQTFDPDLMGALLNGDTTDLFYAHIRRQGAEPLMFTLNPHEVEAVSLSGRATRWWAKDREILSQFPPQGRPRDEQRTGERTDPAEIRRYIMNVDLPQSGIGEIAFAATRQARDHRQQRGRAMGGVRAVRQAEGGLGAMGRRRAGHRVQGQGQPVPLGPARQPHAAGRDSDALDRVSRGLDRAHHRFLPDQGLGGVVPAVARRPDSRDVRPHLQHPGQLPARQRRRAGRFQLALAR